MDIDEYLESLMKTEKASKFPLSMYYSEGTKYLKLFQYEKAFQFLNEARERDPTNIQYLLKRSKCYIGLEEYKKAVEDADKALQLCPNNVHAIDLKGEAQYMMGDFEGGYLTYLEGRKSSPANQALRLGAQLCQDALDNCLHPRLGVKYQKGDVINILKSEKNDEKFQNRLKYHTSARDCFRKDAKFMEDLMADENIKSVHGFCKEAIDYIRHHQKFWWMETPFHSRKRCKETKVKEIKKPQKFETNIRICNAAKRRAEFVLKKGKADDCISEATNLLNLTESLLKERESEKMKFKCDAFHLLGLAYRQLKNVSRAFQYFFEERKIATKFNLKLQETKAYHQLGVIYRKTGDTMGTIQCLDKIIEAMHPENVDELLPEKVSSEEIRQLQEIKEWVKNVISEIKKPQESENIRLCNDAKQKAEYALQKGNTTDCISEASTLLNLTSTLLSKEHKNEKMKLKCDGYHLLGLAYKQKKNFNRAFDFFLEELEITEKLNFILPQTKAYHQLGVMYHHTGNTEGTMQCLKKIREAMSPGKVDELIPENASAEEIRQIQEIDEWVKSVIPKFKMVRQEPSEPVKELEDESIVEDILEKVTESVATKEPLELLQYSKTKDEEFISTTVIGSKSDVEDILEKLTESVATKDPVELLQYNKTKDEEFISTTVIGSKTDLPKPGELKKTFESRPEGESEGLDDKSTIEEVLEELTGRIEIEDLIQQVHSIKEKYKSEEFIPSTVINEHALEELAESIATKDPVQPVQYSETKEEEFIPITIIDSKTDLRKPEEVMETYESRQERESESLHHKSSIENFLKELTERIEIEDLMQKVQSIKGKCKSEEFIPSTVIIEHTLGELADTIATKDTVRPVQYCKEKDKIEEYIPSRVIDRKDELDQFEEAKKIHETRRVTMSKRLDDKTAIEHILKKLTERIEMEDPLHLIQSVKGKSTSEKLLPTSISDNKGKFKEIKETYESSIEGKLEGSDDKSSIETISSLVLKTLTEHVAMEDTVQQIQSVKIKSKSEEFIPASVTYSKDKLEKIKQPSKSSRETESEGLDNTYSIEDILKKITKSIAVKDPMQSIPTIISEGKDEPSKHKEVKETYKSRMILDDKPSIEDILKKISQNIAMEYALQPIPPAKGKSKSKEFIPTIISDEEDESDKFKNIRETHKKSTEREPEVSEDESVIEEILEESTESSKNESIIAGALKEPTEITAIEHPVQLVHPIKEKSKSEELIPIAIIDKKDDSAKSKELKETFEQRAEKKTGSMDCKTSTEDILQKSTESLPMKDIEQLVHSIKEKGNIKELIPIMIFDSEDKSGKPEEVKESYESSKERDSKSLDKFSIEEILEKLTERIVAEDSVQPVYSTKEEMEEFIPATTFYGKKEIDKLEKVNEMHETERTSKSKEIEDEAVIEEISEEPTLNIEAEDTIKLVQSIKEKEKVEELMAGMIINGKDESEKLEGKKEVGKSSRETLPADSDEESITEEISEDLTDDESIIEDTMKELTEIIASKQPVQLVQSVKEKGITEELIPTTIVERKMESVDCIEVEETFESNTERESGESDEESITEEISEDLTEIESIIEGTLKELSENIASRQPVQLVQSVKERSITGELIPTTIVERKKESVDCIELKETSKSSTERESEDLDEESITENFSEDLTDDESIIEDTLKELTESIASKQAVQLVQSVKERSITEGLIPTTVVERKKESDEFKEVKETLKASTERESEDSDEESITEEISEDLTSDESIIEDTLKELTKSIASKQPVQLVQSVKGRSITEELIPTTIIERKKESDEFKVKETRKSSTERDSEDSDDESVIEEILEELTESLVIEDMEQQVTPGLEKKFEKLDDSTKMRPIEEASGLCKPVKMGKSPASTKQTEKSDNSVTRGLTEDRKEPSKFEKITKVKQSAKQAEKSDDLRTYGLSEDKNESSSFKGYKIRQVSKPIKKQKKMVDLEADFVVEHENTPIIWKRTKEPKRSKGKSRDEEMSEKVAASDVTEDDKGIEISREERTSDDSKTKFIKKDDDDDENAYS